MLPWCFNENCNLCVAVCVCVCVCVVQKEIGFVLWLYVMFLAIYGSVVVVVRSRPIIGRNSLFF